MPVTPTIQNVFPTVGASADVWGGILNSRGGETYTDITALAAQGNATEAAVTGAMPKTGGIFTGDVVLSPAGPSNIYSAGFRGIPVAALDVDTTLTLAQAGTQLRFFGPNARTWTIPPLSSVGFPLGTTIMIRSFAGANLTIARGAGVQLRVPGSAVDANRTITPYGWCSLTQEDTNMWLLSGVGAS